jgi:hypothetical protein
MSFLSRASHALCLAGATLSLLSAQACQGQVSQDPPIVIERNMYTQERYEAQGRSAFFADHGGMRPLVEDTVPREGYETDPSVATGILTDASGYVPIVPDLVLARMGGMSGALIRGRERYDVYCTPCHGRTGDGKGMVARVPAGFPPLPSLTDPRIRALPDGQIFATITNGVRLMPPYGAQVPIDDRWAIVSYVRALEMSQLAAQPGADGGTTP